MHSGPAGLLYGCMVGHLGSVQDSKNIPPSSSTYRPCALGQMVALASICSCKKEVTLLQIFCKV